MGHRYTQKNSAILNKIKIKHTKNRIPFKIFAADEKVIVLDGIVAEGIINELRWKLYRPWIAAILFF